MERKHRLRKVRNKTSVQLDYVLLGVILLVAAVLRLWKLGQVPFMHDEFSALFRLKFDNFHDLILYGVKEGDSHPAGVQVFLYYWTQLVGWNELWVKLPFALMGIASVYLIYHIGQQWFNRKVGLLAAAFFAVSQLTVFHSQLARPYAPGLFFVLLMTFFWNKILFDTKKPSVGTCIGFAVCACLAALAHNFSAAQAGLIFLSGLFSLPKERRKAYWLSGIGAIALYAPHLPVFYYQTFVYGSIGGWLAKPKSTFLVDFLQYTMNYAPLFMFAMGVIVVLPFILQKPEKRKHPVRWAAIAWFVIIFALAFIYSLLREPIIQYSTLIFCFPFLVLMMLSFHRNNSLTMTETAIAVIAILFIGASSLITNRQHYDLMYHQGYDQIAQRMQQDNDSIDDIQFATVTVNAQFPEFYQAKTEVTHRVIFDERDNTVADFRNWLRSDDNQNLGFGWTDYADPAWETQAVAYFPYLLHKDTWYTSRYLTLSKGSESPEATQQLHVLSSDMAYYNNNEWGWSRIILGDSLFVDTDILGIVAETYSSDTVHNCVFVMEVRDADTDSLLLWHGNECGTMLPGTNRVVAALRFDEKSIPIHGKLIKTYLWDKSREPLVVSNTFYYYSRFNSRLTGLHEPL